MNFNYPRAKVLSELVSEHSVNTPNKVAVNDGTISFTYEELEHISNKLASQLINDGIKKGDRVCLIARKSSHLIPFAIAIWKAGAVYSPLDSELPKERLEKIVKNITPMAIVGDERDRQLFDHLNIPVQYYYDNYLELVKSTELVSFPNVTEDDNAIIIHTSGTTGLPKGVVLQHLSVVAYINSHRFTLNSNNESRCMNTSSFHFDVSIQDTFLPLYFGAYVYLYKYLFLSEIALPLIQKERFTLVTAMATIFALITGDLEDLENYDFPDLKYISTGAEVCSVKLINKWVSTNPGLTILYGYGPSEANSAAVSIVIDEPDNDRETYYPIGKPHKGVKAILVDENEKIVTEKKRDGEILLGGNQLMNYYWANEEATNKAFVEIEGEKYYRTGDICFYDDDRNLVYNGRKDFEVKYNGRRINLTEITAMVSSNFHFQGVDCHQIRISDSLSYLNMVIKVKNYEGIEEISKSIIKYLREKLPYHSIPNVYSFYDQELRTSSGKINRKYLFDLCAQAMKNGKENLLIYQENAFQPLYSKV